MGGRNGHGDLDGDRRGFPCGHPLANREGSLGPNTGVGYRWEMGLLDSRAGVDDGHVRLPVDGH